ncbi:unnamed protein product [Spirodela intermedia]|uniref:Glycosyltransferase n=2 Tax=Spirodela intermedia TaxID=51605 RepID=A0A7I8K0B7_SPIIN|nr:unnamed protein product [Spirodela intermedia]CAA6655066.1 unnamed protein product [Spirodela intermedia]CAA7389816.1 unnamed protein product [Spirodela intermedia]
MAAAPPHVLLLPLPLLGHVSPMLKLAKVLSLRGLLVTFLTTEHVHRRLSADEGLNCRPGFSFRSIPDGLPADHPRSGGQFTELVKSLGAQIYEKYRDLLVSLREPWPVTCTIVDGLLPFAAEVGEELEIPVIVFRTSGPCSFWTYFCIPRLIEAGEIPFPVGCDMDELVRSVPGMEGFLRRRDLPSICRVKESSDPILQAIASATQRTTHYRGLIFNTGETLDAAELAHIRSTCPVTYTVGPLDTILCALDRSTGSAAGPPSSSSPGWWREDRTCMPWLDAQSPKSVVYVSFGSLTVLSRPQLLEFWHGLANCGHRFLWVIRPDLLEEMDGAGDIPVELAEATKEKGCLVEWVDQREVLGHPAVGAFLTHSGWNSTIEAISAGVPMICWPFFFDQMVNSRFISEVWRIGVDMKDTCDRATVGRMVNEVMEGERADEMRRNVVGLSEMVRECVDEGGSSRIHLDQLIDDIRALSLEASPSR